MIKIMEAKIKPSVIALKMMLKYLYNFSLLYFDSIFFEIDS